MNSGTRIVVFRIREIVYTLLLLFLAVILIICLVIMFSGSQKSGETDAISGETANNAGTDISAGEPASGTGTDGSADESAVSTGANASSDEAAGAVSAASGSGTAEVSSSYTAGVYLASVNLGDLAAEVEVTVDPDRIRAIRLVNLTEEMQEEYPLISSAIEALAEQILEKQSLEEITAPLESRYTSQMLLNAVSKALETALE